MKPAGQAVWTKVDRYFGESARARRPHARRRSQSQRAGWPSADRRDQLQGKFLEFLVRISGARRVLEIGTLGGYSTIWLGPRAARKTAASSRSNSTRATPRLLAPICKTRVSWTASICAWGQPLNHWQPLRTQPPGRAEPFDLIFIDADKQGYPGLS
jgi:predicted O-methyltransferase YrrM